MPYSVEEIKSWQESHGIKTSASVVEQVAEEVPSVAEHRESQVSSQAFDTNGPAEGPPVAEHDFYQDARPPYPSDREGPL